MQIKQKRCQKIGKIVCLYACARSYGQVQSRFGIAAILTSTYMGTLINVCALNQLSPGQSRVIEHNGENIAVFNVAGSIYACADTCTHAGGPLSEGEISDCKIICPWHNASFDLKTGAALDAPAFTPIKIYKVVIEQDLIKLEL